MSFFEEDKKQAEQGSSTAQFNLGITYWKGDGIDINLKEAEFWLTKAAEQENVEAFSALGGVYMQMEDYQKSIEFYELAVDKGSASAEGALGAMYYRGFGIDVDYKKAFVLLKKAASRILGGAHNQAEAQCYLGNMFINAQGTEQNIEEGIVWLKRSAVIGNSDAEATLGMVYKDGIGVEQNFDEAYSWLLKAAKNNHAKAQSEICSFYQKGLGSITKNLDTAFIWLKKSAENGDGIAQSTLGHHYRLGSAANELDEHEATKWFERAVVSGHYESSKWAGILNLKQENIKEAAFFLQVASKMGDQESEELCKKHGLWDFKFE